MHKRMVIVFSVLMVIFTMLYVRIAVISTDSKYVTASTAQTKKVLTVAKTRGMIYDRNLNPLVNKEYKEEFSVWVDNKDRIKLTEKLYTFQKSKLDNLIDQGKPFVTDITLPYGEVEGVKKFFVPIRYNQNQLARHVIGYLDSDGVGVSGIERAFDGFLTSESDSTTISYEVNGLGQKIGNNTEVNIAKPITSGVVLTLDSDIQRITEEVGAKYIKKGAVVVMDTSTGELLSVASFPNFDSNNVSKSINDTQNYPLLNKAINAYTVGSTFKLVACVTALESGYSPDLVYNCRGFINVQGNIFRCHNRNGHGEVDMEKALEVSCNPYFIDLARKCTREDLYTKATQLSFGRGYELAHGIWTGRGYMPDIRYGKNAGDIANFAFGQGELLATPIQITQMMNTIANGGDMLAPILFKGYTSDGEGLTKEAAQVVSQRIMKPATAKKIKQMLTKTVMEGNNQKSRPDQISAAGKTATAQTGRFYDKEKKDEKVNTWFTGFFPADKPRYTVTVLVEDGTTGNSSASPVFKGIADRIYN